MSKILSDLYYGRISPCERKRSIHSEPERSLLQENINSERSHLEEIMSEENCKRLERLEELYSAESDMENVEAFGAGFRLAVTLMLDVFSTDYLPKTQ